MGKDALARYREFQRRLAQYTQELSAEMFPEGLPGGLTFSDLEEAAERVGNQVSRDLIERHIQARPEEVPGTCPECHGPLKPDQNRDRRTYDHSRPGGLDGEDDPLSPLSAGFFPPRDRTLGLDGTSYSPRLQRKMVSAGVRAESYRAASESLAELGDCEIDPKVIERLVHRIGQERIDARDAAVAAHQDLPLMRRDDVADGARPCPAVAMVSVDGGRLQVRGTTAEPGQRTHWRESKTAVLETYLGPTHDADPDRDVPRCFLDLKRTVTMVRGLGHALPKGLEFEGNATR